MKDVIVIGGPNGAGKTTAASRLLPITLGLHEFLNADEIARGLSPFDPEANALAAGRLMIDRIDKLVAAGKTFSFETTCAGHRQVKLLRSMPGRRLPRYVHFSMATFAASGDLARCSARGAWWAQYS